MGQDRARAAAAAVPHVQMPVNDGKSDRKRHPAGEQMCRDDDVPGCLAGTDGNYVCMYVT